MVPQTFSIRHGIGFAIMHAFLIGIDFANLNYWWMWVGAALAFFVPEFAGAFANAAARRRGDAVKIDTLSQIMWAFLRAGPARIPVALGWIAWVALLSSELIGPKRLIYGVEAAGFCLLAGVALWLTPHFLFRGRYG